jgi:hypothetical protein
VPKLLTKEQKHERVRVSQECFLIIPTHLTCHLLIFFLIPKVKEQLENINLTQGTFKSNLEQATRTITIDEFAAAYRRWLQ